MSIRQRAVAASVSIAILLFLVGVTLAHAAPTATQPQNGGTGTTAIPSYGQVLVGNGSGTYTPQATSTLGISGGGVSSVFGRAGAVTAQSGDYSTSQVTEGSNLYFTNARAVSALTGQNISIFNNNAGYLTSLAGAASSTLLGDSNTFSGNDAFTNASSNFAGTWQSHSPSYFQTALSGTTGQIAYFSGANTAVGTSSIWISQAGNVGIGTTTPQSRLDLQVNETEQGLWAHDASASSTSGGSFYGLKSLNTLELGPLANQNFQQFIADNDQFSGNDDLVNNFIDGPADNFAYGFEANTGSGVNPLGADYMMPGGGFAYQDANFNLPGAMYEVDPETVGLGFCQLTADDNSDCAASFSTNFSNNSAEVGFGGSQTGNSILSVYGSTAIGSDYFNANPPTNGLLVEGSVGIGTTTPYSPLEVWGPDTAKTSAFAVVNSASTTVFKVTDNGAVITGGTTPTIATSTGIGVFGGTATIQGTENSQEIVIKTGSGTVNSGLVATVTLPTSCPTAPVPTFSAANQKAAAQAGSGSIYMASSTANSYTIDSGTVGLTATTTFAWNVHVDCW